MSTSPRLSPQSPAETARPDPQPFPYAHVPARTAGTALAGQGDWSTEASAAEGAAHESRIRSQARQEGQEEARRMFDQQLAEERASVAAALTQFAQDRALYFQKIEGEVVQLALSVARKILHREAQLDPLLLAGIVRVVLEKIEGATDLRLRVSPQRGEEWRRYLASHVDPAMLPKIIEDPSQDPHACVLQTSMGTTVIGMDVQLKEIEQGLMDLLSARPGVMP